MKLTKQQLKQLIKEELQNALQEAAPPRSVRHRKRMQRMRQPPQPPREGRSGEELTLDDIFAELQEIKGLISREMTPAGLGIEGAP